MDKKACVLIVGHDDVIERSLTNYFKQEGFENVYSATDIALNTTIQASVHEFFQAKRPEYVFLGSVASGGIEANQKFPGDFFYKNSASQNNVIYAAHKFDVKKVLYYASSCVYPKDAVQPMQAGMLFTGALESTSQSYAVAKLSGLQLMQAYRRQYGLNVICAIPATVYGPGSDTDLEHAHVMGALIAKFSYAAQHKDPLITVWGSGNPRREFIYASDFAEASLFLMDHYDDEAVINIGVGDDVAIKELSEMIAGEAGYTGSIEFDHSKADGAMRKLLDSSEIYKLGWQPKVDLSEGLKQTIQWFQNSKE